MPSSCLRLLVSLVWLWGSLAVWSDQRPADPWRGAKRVAPGIVLKTYEVKKPRLQKWFCVRVDTGNERIGFQVTGPSPNIGEPMPDYPKLKQVTVRQRTVDFLNECRKPVRKGGKGLDMVLAVNGAPWSPWCSPWNHKYAANLGLLVSEGKQVGEQVSGPSFVVYRSGRMRIVGPHKNVKLKNVWCAISGFQVVLDYGDVSAAVHANKSLAPRVGYGISRDRRYFYIVLVDGRQPGYSMGATVGEVGEKLKELGAWKGLNMDGGGSSTLVVEKRGKGVVLNRHGSGGYTRPVGASLGVYLKRHSQR